MLPKGANRESIFEALDDLGGLRDGVVQEVRRRTGVPAADVYGVATFYELLAEPDARVRVCQGLSCHVAGCQKLYNDLETLDLKPVYSSCLGRCDQAPASWDRQSQEPVFQTGLTASHDALAIDLSRGDGESPVYEALELARQQGASWVVDQLEASGVTGRGGAAFPAHIKWRGGSSQEETERYVVLNADEAEPGTFKDREIMMRRPQRVIEGLAIAAETLGAQDVYLSVRGEVQRPLHALQEAIA